MENDRADLIAGDDATASNASGADAGNQHRRHCLPYQISTWVLLTLLLVVVVGLGIVAWRTFNRADASGGSVQTYTRQECTAMCPTATGKCAKFPSGTYTQKLSVPHGFLKGVAKAVEATAEITFVVDCQAMTLDFTVVVQPTWALGSLPATTVHTEKVPLKYIDGDCNIVWDTTYPPLVLIGRKQGDPGYEDGKSYGAVLQSVTYNETADAIRGLLHINYTTALAGLSVIIDTEPAGLQLALSNSSKGKRPCASTAVQPDKSGPSPTPPSVPPAAPTTSGPLSCPHVCATPQCTTGGVLGIGSNKHAFNAMGFSHACKDTGCRYSCGDDFCCN